MDKKQEKKQDKKLRKKQGKKQDKKPSNISFPALKPLTPPPTRSPIKEKFSVLPGDCVYESSDADPVLFRALFEILQDKIRKEKWSDSKRHAILTFAEMQVEDGLRMTYDFHRQFIVQKNRNTSDANLIPAIQFFLKGTKLSLSLLYKAKSDMMSEEKLGTLVVALIERFLDVGILIDSVHCPSNEKNFNVYNMMGLDLPKRKHCLTLGKQMQNIYFNHNMPKDDLLGDDDIAE